MIGRSERTVTVEFSFINEKGFVRPNSHTFLMKEATVSFLEFMMGCSQFSNHIGCLDEKHISSNVRYCQLEYKQRISITQVYEDVHICILLMGR